MTEQKRTFIQNVMVLFTGTAVSQLIPFLVLPILRKNYYGPVSGLSLTAIFQYFQYRRDVADVERRNFSKWKLLGDHKSFIFHTTLIVFVGAFINFLSIEMFVENFGPASAGMVSVPMTYVGAGLGMVAASISLVYYGTISGIHERKAVLSLYAKFLVRLTVILAVMTVLVWVLPASWVVGVLGDEWNDLIVYCRLISLWLGVWFVSSSLSFIYLRLQRQREMLVFDVLHIILVYASFHAGKAWGGDALSALWGFTWAQIISYVIAIALAIRFIQVSKSLR
jgi:hypothetical protein